MLPISMYLLIILVISAFIPKSLCLKCRTCISFDLADAKSHSQRSLKPWLSTVSQETISGPKCNENTNIKTQISNCKRGVCQSISINATDSLYEWSSCLPRSRGFITKGCTRIDHNNTTIQICTCVKNFCNGKPTFLNNLRELKKLRSVRKLKEDVKYVEAMEMTSLPATGPTVSTTTDKFKYVLSKNGQFKLKSSDILLVLIYFIRKICLI